MAKTAKGANRYESFEVMTVKRSDIHGADYNPRKISSSAQAKLKRFLKKKDGGGLLMPLTWNQKTGNLVSGHQRLEILDQLHKGKPYELTVAVVDMSEEEEVKANVFMNNPSAQGEWDLDILGQLKDLIPDLDYEVDLGFEPEELDVMGLLPAIEAVDDEPDGDEGPSDSGPTDSQREAFRAAKKRGRENAKSDNENGNGSTYSQGDFTLSLIFPSADDKRNFLKSIGQNPRLVRINSIVIENLVKSTAS